MSSISKKIERGFDLAERGLIALIKILTILLALAIFCMLLLGISESIGT